MRPARRAPAPRSPLPWSRRPLGDRRTRALALSALLTGGTVAVSEVARVWRRGSAPLPAAAAGADGAGGGRIADGDAAGRLAAAGAEAIGQTVEVAVRGYQGGSTRENALLNLLGSFTITWALVRSSTHVIRRRGTFGPFRNVVVRDRHVHHFVPGIALAFLAGGVSVVSRRKALDAWLAVPFGTGVALTLDESALLLQLDDVYWTEEGIVSVQISLAALAMLSSLALALRVLRRGERVVLAPAAADERA